MQSDPKYREKESDCVTFCDSGGSYIKKGNLGRGSCVNRNFVFDWEKGSSKGYTEKTCCLCENIEECNTCSCVDNIVKVTNN